MKLKIGRKIYELEKDEKIYHHLKWGHWFISRGSDWLRIAEGRIKNMDRKLILNKIGEQELLYIGQYSSWVEVYEIDYDYVDENVIY